MISSVLPAVVQAQLVERTVTDLGTLGGKGTEVEHINEAGTVTGMSQDARRTRSARDLRGSWQAFVKRIDEPMIDLLELNGVHPLFINESELVVGTRFGSSGQSYASFRLRIGRDIENLPEPSTEGSFGRPSDLDDAGNVLMNMGGRAFLFRARGGDFVALACDLDHDCEATAMNEAGVIVGVAIASSDAASLTPRLRPLLWASASAAPVDLPSDAEHSVRPVDVNAHCTILGIAAADDAPAVVVWEGSEHGLRHLGAGVPRALNDHDFAVGKALAPDGDFFASQPVLWDLRTGERTALPLSTAAGSGGALHDLNNAGQIIGTTYDAAGHSRGVLYRGWAAPR